MYKCLTVSCIYASLQTQDLSLQIFFMQASPLVSLLKENAALFAPVVPFSPGKDKLLLLDFTASNQELTDNLPVLREALNYERPPDPQVEREGPTCLSESCKEFTAHFTDSLKQVQEVGQDAFFIWY